MSKEQTWRGDILWGGDTPIRGKGRHNWQVDYAGENYTNPIKKKTCTKKVHTDTYRKERWEQNTHREKTNRKSGQTQR